MVPFISSCCISFYNEPPIYDKTFTPHARGSTLGRRLRGLEERVYPACAGIDPPQPPALTRNNSLPRMRGDRPPSAHSANLVNGFTPHARGSTFLTLENKEVVEVYPACAGIDLPNCLYPAGAVCLPRMRGDRPLHSLPSSSIAGFTPHARGSTQ